MAHQILMPRQGNTVESCIILEWKTKEGEAVSAGDILCEVETDKATFEVEAPDAGQVLKIYFQEGDDVPVLTPIAVLGKPGEDISGLGPEEGGASTADVASAPAVAAGVDSPGPDAAAAEPAISAGVPAPAAATGRVAISPRARKLAERSGLDYRGLAGAGSGPGARIIERDVQAVLDAGAPLTPVAAERRAAEGLVAPQLGTGIGGRVRAQDLTAAAAGAGTGPAAGGAGDQAYPGPTTVTEVKGVRKLIADRMLASLTTTAQLTLHGSADARQLLAYRKKCKESPEYMGLRNITINDLVMFAAVRTLRYHSELNAEFKDGAVVQYDRVHAGFAVDTFRGLMVPVVRFADLISLKDLAAETSRLGEACLEGGIKPDELSGGTFTVTNLGALGVEMFTPILNAPQVAILGVCSIEPKAVMDGAEVSFIPHIGLSLTIDHRVVDGAPAARYLRDLAVTIGSFDLSLAG